MDSARSADLSAGQAEAGLFADYPSNGAYDEMFDAHGTPRAQYKALYEQLVPLGLSEFQTSLVGLANTLDVHDSPRMRVLRLAHSIVDEHDAAVHVREVATQFVESA